jgi:hypothetical protein
VRKGGEAAVTANGKRTTVYRELAVALTPVQPIDPPPQPVYLYRLS